MKAIFATLTFAISLGFMATPSPAATRVGIYALVDEVTLEPDEYAPQRALISGVFVVPVPISSGDHRPPERGYLYFELNPALPNATRHDWQALARAAGTGRVVGFGDYWVPRQDPTLPGVVNFSLEVRVHARRDTVVPEPYPTPNEEGIVTAFDTAQDRCPRFGKPSGEIIARLRETYRHFGSGVLSADHADVPACGEWRGLVASSSLASAYATQTRDPVWAAAAEAMIYGRIGQASGLELSEFRVECRATICYLRFVYASERHRRSTGETAVANGLNELPGFNTSGQIVYARDGTPSVEYFLQYVQAGRPASTEAAGVRSTN